MHDPLNVKFRYPFGTGVIMLIGVGAFNGIETRSILIFKSTGIALLLLKRGTRFKSLIVQWLSRTKCFVRKCTAVIILWSE